MITLRLGHSPDPDDAFMWWPLLEVDGAPPRLVTEAFRFEAVEQDIELLNQRSDRGELEITAMSCAQYPHVHDRYAITACGASMGAGYGPKLVAARPMDLDDLRGGGGAVIAIPGRRTSAFAALRLLLGRDRFAAEVVPFDRIIEAVADGSFAAGVVIHEGQLTFEQAGLHLLVDLGAWWGEHTGGLPLPLGLNTVRRDLEQAHGPGTLHRIATALQRSVRYAMDHRAESIDYALRFARGIDAEVADRFVSLYVNRWTLDFGETGRAAVRRFLGELHEAGIAPDAGEVDAV